MHGRGRQGRPRPDRASLSGLEACLRPPQAALNPPYASSLAYPAPTLQAQAISRLEACLHLPEAALLVLQPVSAGLQRAMLGHRPTGALLALSQGGLQLAHLLRIM